MWRKQAALPRMYCLALALAVLAVLDADRLVAHARIQYTEGGSFGEPSYASDPDDPGDSGEPVYASDPGDGSESGEYDLLRQVNSEQRIPEEDERLAGILHELQHARASSRDEEWADASEAGDPEVDELQRFGAQIRELSESHAPEEEFEPNAVETTKPSTRPKTEKPLTAQKKGQSEFVEFVEPVHVKLASKNLKNREMLEKRVVDYRHLRQEEEGDVGLMYSSGNVLFMAFVTMCCVLSVIGIVGGAYYYKHVRAVNEDPFDDFTRYSPAGPGRDKLKKNFACEKGDETLAYKAQLHHYQQTKQKIIGDGLGGGRVGTGTLEDDTSDKSDDEADLEHNFSVYECPGLAPTGDIEVQNPNFVDSAASSPTQDP